MATTQVMHAATRPAARRNEFHDPATFVTLVTRALASPQRALVCVLRATMRDLGEEALEAAIRAEPACAGMTCDLGEGEYAILVCTKRLDEVNRLASRIADATSERAARDGHLHVQTLTAAFVARDGSLDPYELLNGAEHALAFVRHRLAELAYPHTIH